MKMIIDSPSPQATHTIGMALGGLLRAIPAVVLLTGDLGAGKTALTKAMVEGMGITELVTSPTYTLVNAYGEEGLKAYHFDLYRLEDMDELTEIGFEEFLEEQIPIIIEWPQILGDYPLGRVMTIHLERTDTTDERRITIHTEDRLLTKGLEKLG